MATCSLELQLDASDICGKAERLKSLLQQIPKRAAKRFARKALALVNHGLVLENVEPIRDAAETPNSRIVGRLRLNIVGIDELIAAATRRAAKFQCDRYRVHE